MTQSIEDNDYGTRMPSSRPPRRRQRRRLKRTVVTLWFLVAVCFASALTQWRTAVSFQTEDKAFLKKHPLDEPPSPLIQLSPPPPPPPPQQQQQQQQQQLEASISKASSTTRAEQQVVIVMIAMGNATRTKFAERCIYSIQRNGRWNGTILVLTGKSDFFYQERFQDNPKVVVIPAHPADLHPMHNTTALVQYKTRVMIFKRFKTLLTNYVQEFLESSPSLSFSHVLYLDIDIVVAQPLEPFLIRQLSKKNHTTASYMSAFPDCPTCAKNILNSGILWLHLLNSQTCLKEWRYFMDTSPHTKRDQSTLRKVKLYSSSCRLLPIHPKTDCMYPNWNHMRLLNVSVFVHNSNTYGSTRIPEKVQRRYFTTLLNTTEFDFVEHY